MLTVAAVCDFENLDFLLQNKKSHTPNQNFADIACDLALNIAKHSIYMLHRSMSTYNKASAGSSKWGPIWAPGTLDLRNVRLRNVWFSAIENIENVTRKFSFQAFFKILLIRQLIFFI